MDNLTTDREELRKILQKTFPKLWLKDSEEFSPEYKGGFWTGEGSHTDDEFETPIFNYWDETEVLYQMGVFTPLANLLEEHGWYAEAHDPGTYMIMPI